MISNHKGWGWNQEFELRSSLKPFHSAWYVQEVGTLHSLTQGIKNVPQHHWIEKNREITEKWKLFWSAQSSKNLHTIFLSKLSRASLFPNVSKAKNQSNTYPSRINMFSTLCSEHRRALHRLVPAFKQFTKSKGRREVHKHNQVRSRSGLVPCECWKSPTTVECQGLFRWRHY